MKHAPFLEKTLLLSSKANDNIIVLPENCQLVSLVVEKCDGNRKEINPAFKFPAKRIDLSIAPIHKKPLNISIDDQIFALSTEISKLESQVTHTSSEDLEKVAELEFLCSKWKGALSLAIEDFRRLLNEKSENPISISEILQKLGIEPELVGYDEENEEFVN